MGDLLRIDLAARTAREESLPDDLMRECVGGKGIGTRILLNEVPPETDPLGPGSKLIFCTGPITGTSMPGSNRYAAVFLSPLTNGYGESYSGGRLGAQFAKTGYKVVILENAAATPVYLEISEAGVSFHDADHLWGLDTYETEDRLLAAVGVPKAEACVIGPAGENLVRFACIENNKWRSLGRGGAGAVMGSKKVKGIVFHGARKIEAARPDRFKELIGGIVERGKSDPGVANLKKFGTVNLVRTVNSAEMFPTRYWTKSRLDDFEPVSGETMIETYHVKNVTCPPCFIACGNLNRVPEDHPTLAGLELDGPEFETIYAFGALCEIVDFPEIMRMNDICDRLGVDTITAGNLCGLAMEACHQGRLDLGLEYGDADGTAQFLTDVCRRNGAVPSVFADGILAVEREFDLSDVAVHVKGMEPAAFDPRSSTGMGLGYAVSSRGACHMRATFSKPEFMGLIGPREISGKAKIYVDWENWYAIQDCMVYCRFYRDLIPWPVLTEVASAATGFDYTAEDLRAIANRIVTESHIINERRGIGAGHDRLPKWITTRPLKTTSGETWAISDEDVELMRREYYEVRGW
jgi:aldehyde:ferredoxin oxidoreductase